MSTQNPEENTTQENVSDSYADALVAVVITAVFVATSIYWIAGQ